MVKITIRDIAKQPGVSTATISWVLNSSPKVSPEVHNTILRVIKELGYHPSQAVRELKNKGPKTIALATADGANEYYFQIAQAIIHAIQEKGCALFICNSFNNSEIERNYLIMLSKHRIDGLVLDSCDGNNELVISLGQKIPTVLIHRQIDHPRFVGGLTDVDFGISTCEITMGLIRDHHTKIGIICGPTRSSSVAERLQQFERTVASIHITVDRDYRYFLEDPRDSTSGYEILERFLRLPHSPTALAAAYNEACIDALGYCHDHNIPIPETLSIVAPYSVNLCGLFYAQPIYALSDTWALGLKISQMLLERIQGENQLLNRRTIYIPRIMQDNSVSCPGDLRQIS